MPEEAAGAAGGWRLVWQCCPGCRHSVGSREHAAG